MKHCKILSFLLVAICAGCEQISEVKNFIAQVQATTHSSIEPLPEFKVISPFTYAAQNLRDPFSMIGDLKQTSSYIGTLPTHGKPQPLEQFNLGQLSLVGVLQESEKTWALILAPDKRIYHVQVGNYMGKNYGQITKITENAVDINELYPNYDGTWLQKSTTIKLEQKENHSENTD